MNLFFGENATKKEVFNSVEQFLAEKEFITINRDDSRPWGGFFVINEAQSLKFKTDFFNEIDENSEKGKMSPKILIVQPHKRLSWQYHHRRSEIWKVIGGEVGIKRSENDIEGALETKKTSEIITLRKGERHRLIGLDSWGIIAEIWQHTDPNFPSNEDDIVRVQDDFGR